VGTGQEDTRGILRPDAVGTRFALDRRPPSADLADVVEHHWHVSWDLPEGEPFVQEVLPHPCVHLAFEPGGALVYGVKTGLSSHAIEGRGSALGTRFRAAAFRRVAPGPVHTLTDRIVPIAEIFGEAGDRLAAVVAREPDVDGRIARVEAFLRDRLAPPDPAAELAGRIVGALRLAPRGTRVGEVAARHGLSERTLQRHFREHVGVGPKVVLQRHRLHDAADRMAAGDRDFAALATELGYADQAHLIRDFRAATGHSPGRYAAALPGGTGAEQGAVGVHRRTRRPAATR
jgi:AraC-like DNA-binding protein